MDRWDELVGAYYMVDLVRQRPHKLTGMVLSWCIERVEHDKLDAWMEELNDLLPWQDASTLAAEEAESASFFSMMSKQQ